MRAGIRSRPWAGLDLGSYSVKLFASLAGVGGTRHWMAELPIPPLEARESPPGREALARVIGDAMTQAGVAPRGLRGISMGISGSDVIVKQISLPMMAEEEVGPALRFEARKHIPFDPQGMIIDFQVLGRYASEKRLDVLLAAVSERHVDELIAPLKLLGIDADIVDATPLALTNAIHAVAESDRDRIMLLDIGHTTSHLILYQRGEPFFARRLEFGGHSLTQAISDGVRIPLDEAEEWKVAAGSDTPGFNVDWDCPELQAARRGLELGLVEEVRRSFAFYRTLGKLPDSVRLSISGGSARLPGLTAQLENLLGIPVQIFNPLDEMGGGQRRGRRPTAGPQFAQAYGLSLRTT